MKEIKTEIIINAPIEKIWANLLDFSSYKDWNPFIIKVKGQPVINNKIEVTVKPDGQKPMSFSAQIIKASNYELIWLGGMAIPGIFNGRHQFKLEEIAPNQVKIIHSETFSGILSRPIFALINKSSVAGFNNMNQVLKARCEVA